MVTVFSSIFNQMEFHLVQNRKEKCHHDHIPLYVKGIGNIVFSVKTFLVALEYISQEDRRVKMSHDGYALINDGLINNGFISK